MCLSEEDKLKDCRWLDLIGSSYYNTCMGRYVHFHSGSDPPALLVSVSLGVRVEPRLNCKLSSKHLENSSIRGEAKVNRGQSEKGMALDCGVSSLLRLVTSPSP
jgi:hypothetical protein